MFFCLGVAPKNRVFCWLHFSQGRGVSENLRGHKLKSLVISVRVGAAGDVAAQIASDLQPRVEAN